MGSADVFFAHSKEGFPPEDWQSLEEHLQKVAKIAGRFGEAFNAKDWAFLAGLFHDFGKYSKEFQSRLQATADSDAHCENLPGRVDHSTSGAQQFVKRADSQGVKIESAALLLAYAVAGHHSGIPDGRSNSQSCLRSRLGKVVPLATVSSESLWPDLEWPILPFDLISDHKTIGNRLGLFIRMLYSCLVDADFLDTERFLDSRKHRLREGYPNLDRISKRFFQKLEALNKLAPELPINVIRHSIQEQCLKASISVPGFFCLTVPTGGGKTLSSLAFALRHAERYGMKRVIYVIPFTSIIEQNAKVFREFAGEDTVLEHHSNYEPKEEDHRSRLASENWDAPIVVTTNVQFFESLFGNRSSVCRKLHNIAGSVIILDEAQQLPAEKLLPCLMALRELKANYHCSVVLCTATQPALNKRVEFPSGIEEVREIVDAPDRLFHELKRVDIIHDGKLSIEDLAARLDKHPQVLCIVNTRKQAQTVYESLCGEGQAWHLSALMCPAHRSWVLDQIKNELKDQKPCRVVSTQLVEAGVDIDFPVVYRALAGIDSLAQAAGRCNREGKLLRGTTYVFETEDKMPLFIRQAAQAAQEIIRKHPGEILSLEAVEDYFQHYYWLQEDRLDADGILQKTAADLANGNFPFHEIALKFKIIKNIQTPVIIPWDDSSRELINSLRYAEHTGALARKLQRYTVQVFKGTIDALIKAHALEIIQGQYSVLKEDYRRLYRDDIGLYVKNLMDYDPEELIA